jgi:hypothetical protein
LRSTIGVVGWPNVLIIVLMKSTSCFDSQPRSWRHFVQVSRCPDLIAAKRLRHFGQTPGIMTVIGVVC